MNLGLKATTLPPVTVVGGTVKFSCCGVQQESTQSEGEAFPGAKCHVCGVVFDLIIFPRMPSDSVWVKGSKVQLLEKTVAKVGCKERVLEPGIYTVFEDPFDVMGTLKDTTLIGVTIPGTVDKKRVLLALVSNNALKLVGEL